MKHWYLAASLITTCFATLTFAAAKPYGGSMRFYDELPGVVFLAGEIAQQDSFELRKVMRDQDIKLVVTVSPGGNLYEGLQMASIIHDNGLGTYVPEDQSCESSCANIFLGGTSRMLLGDLGVHQFYHAGGGNDQAFKDETTSEVLYTTSDIIGIMNQFDTPPFVYEKMFGTTDIYYFEGADKFRLSRNTEDAAFLSLIASVDTFIEQHPEATRRTAPVPEPEVVATKQPPAAPGPTSREEPLVNIDFFGMDLSSSGVRNVSIAECENICRRDNRCAAWSYVHATRWCWPKSGVQNFSLADGVTSGVVNPDAVDMSMFDRPFLEVTGKDIVGYDIFPRGIRNTTLPGCRAICARNADCDGFSWVANQNWCFPKYGVGELRTQIGVISGVWNPE